MRPKSLQETANDVPEMTSAIQPKKPRTTPPELRLAAKLDALLSDCPEWARQWAISWIVAKYRPQNREEYVGRKLQELAEGETD